MTVPTQGACAANLRSMLICEDASDASGRFRQFRLLMFAPWVAVTAMGSTSSHSHPQRRQTASDVLFGHLNSSPRSFCVKTISLCEIHAEPNAGRVDGN